MTKVATMLGAFGLALVLSGCPIWIETESVDDPEPNPCAWGGCVDDCTCNNDCDEGYYCNGGECDATWYCDWDGTCPEGFVCDDRDTCVPDPNDVDPDPPTPCDEDADCDMGYCGDDGFCVDTGSCEGDEDCAVFGGGLICDDRGVCAPEPPPCEDGECGCTDDAECEDGNLCIDSRCTDAMSICVFDFECGSESVCINNDCHMTCVGAEATCPIGQGCVSDVCRDLDIGFDGCVFDEDCTEIEGARCINATCHPTCEADGECGEAESCSSGVCRADTAPQRACTADGGECSADMACVAGVCRMPCAADINCTDGAMAFCGESNFCLFAEELDLPECQRASDCADDMECSNGGCHSPFQQ